MKNDRSLADVENPGSDFALIPVQQEMIRNAEKGQSRVRILEKILMRNRSRASVRRVDYPGVGYCTGICHLARNSPQLGIQRAESHSRPVEIIVEEPRQG